MDNKIVRGWIVRILSRCYPLGMETLSLQKQLYNLGYKVLKKELKAQLAYLQEDGFIEKISYGDEFRDELVNKTYKLTTKGVDLAEGTIEDSGVSI